MTTGRDQEEGQSGPDKTSRALLWIFLAPVLLFAGCTGAVIFSSISGAGDDEPSEGMARVMCEDFVKDRLVSPDSADFSRPTVTDAGRDMWKVSGGVDADNRIGASIRIDYQCTVRGDGDGGWTLVDMKHNER